MNCNSCKPDFIEELKCHVCDNYLSYFPIHINENLGNVCGRCLKEKAIIYVRNKVYEILARQIKFPCRFVEKGCFERLVPKDIPDHEQQCPFRTASCPTKKFTGCSVTESLPYLKQHCEDEHSDVFLRNGRFKIDLCEHETVSRLLQNGNCLFEFSWKYDPATQKLRFCISLLEDTYDMISYFYSVTLKNETRVLTFSGCFGKGIPESEIHKFSLDCLTNPSCYTDIIEGDIYIHKEKILQARPIDQNFLDLFKCVSCQNYIKPPVSISLSGQSKCSSCCSSGLIKNTCLDNIASLMTYPCKFTKNGCNFTAHPVVVQNHESFCLYTSEKCPINEYQTCDWTGFGKNINQHILENHNAMIKTSPEISENVSNNNNIVVCYLMRYSNHFFRLTFWYSSPYYYWAVQMVQKVENNLKFEIEILDSNNNNNKLVTRQNCVPLTKKDQVFKNVDTYCFFTQDQIKNLLSAEKILTYKINIFK